jgi:hypothetical protein
VDVVGVRLCRKPWTKSFLCRWRTCLRSRIARLSDLVLRCSYVLPSLAELSFFFRHCLMEGSRGCRVGPLQCLQEF